MTVSTVVFLILTVAAMLLYPGGRVGDKASLGYSFFTNFFSDLGQTQTHSGASNTTSLVLFCLAIVAIAFDLPLFFAAYSRMLGGLTRLPWTIKFAVVCAIVTAISFLGVAATPWNLYLQAHNDFVTWAFRSLLLAIVLAFVGSLVAPNLPRRFAFIFGAFGVVLVAYVLLIAIGPSPATVQGAAIQASGQKIIVYASVITVLVQSLAARAFIRSGR